MHFYNLFRAFRATSPITAFAWQGDATLGIAGATGLVPEEVCCGRYNDCELVGRPRHRHGRRSFGRDGVR